MPMPNSQPNLPAEGTFNDVERVFIDEQPSIWPENQNSNLGTLRRVITQPLQDAVDTILDVWNQLFVSTADGYLGLWEDQLGLPKASAGRTLAQRRFLVGFRMTIGPFTRTRRKQIVENFIQATFGTAVQLTGAGVPFDGTGIPLYSEYGDVSTLYTITEDVENFHYTVNIVPSVDPDIPGLTRELTHFTPAHISFDITRNP
jgi:hypothetical protein